MSEVLASPGTSAKTKEQLLKVERILAYAESAGLHTAGAYTYLIETAEPVVSYLVQAAKSDQLVFITWWFPVVGDVPYLGYFRKEEADSEAATLRQAGYDVATGGAGAFSSLGWFADPIFSSMLERGDAELAHLFFHELTHRTLWLAGSSSFNENLAEYAASVLTRRYLVDTKAEALVLRRYEQREADHLLFSQWLQQLKAELIKLYSAGGAKEQVLAAKKALLERYQKPPLKPVFAVIDPVKREAWNNASILGASLYAPDTKRFAQAHACLGASTEASSVATFLTALRERAAAYDDAFLALDSLCTKPPGSLPGRPHVD